MQRRAAIWILGAFKMFPSFGIEAIMGLMPINLYLQKLGGRSQLCTCKLPPSHLIRSLINLQLNSDSGLDAVALDSLTNRQQSLVKDHLVDSANRVNEYFPSFNPLNSEFYPGLRVIDNFSDCISFNLFNKEKDNKSHTQSLDEMVLESFLSLSVTIIASDASIKNNVAMFIAHIHTHDKPLIKTIHHAVNVTSMEVELFAIMCGINQATCIDNISKIIVITDLFTWSKEFLTSLSIPSKFSQLLFCLTFAISSTVTPTTLSNFGNAQAVSSGIFIMRSIKKLKCSNYYLSTHAKIHGTSARNAKAMTF